MAKANPAGGSGSDEGRDSWCTPKWLADLLGVFNIDPCSNDRTHILAEAHCLLAAGDDGLLDDHGPGVHIHGARGCSAGEEALPPRRALRTLGRPRDAGRGFLAQARA